MRTSSSEPRVDWPVRRLRFLARLNPSRSEVRHLPPDTAVSFVPMESVGEWGGLTSDDVRPIESVYNGYTFFRDGDVVAAKITPCFENGKGALANGLAGGVAFGTTELHVLRPGPALEPRFLFYVTISHPFRDAGTASMTGAAGQKRVPEHFVLDYELGVPSLPDQKTIADFLDEKTATIDALIAKKERLIDFIEEKRQAAITRAVTKGLDPLVPMRDSGVEWLGEVPARWEIAPLYAKYSVQLGKMLSPEATEGGMPAPYIRNANVQWGRLELDDLREMSFSPADRYKFALRPDDLLVCEGGEVGRTAIWRGELAECFYQKAIHRLRAFGQDIPAFFMFVMRAAAHRGVFLAEGNQSTIVHLTAEKLRRHRFPFPPPAEQKRIAAHLQEEMSACDSVVGAERRIIERLQEYRQTLISAAVTGQIDVRSRSTRAEGVLEEAFA